jgi:hypothetical protein
MSPDASTVDRVGPDRVERAGDDRIVYARRAMPDWEPRRYRRVQVTFHGEDYFVAAAAPTGDGGCMYRLSPWTDDVVDRPAANIRYDLEYVLRRDRDRRSAQGNNLLRLVLIPASPLLGFLPSRWKQWLQARLGINPAAVTAHSIYLEFGVMMALGGALVVYGVAGPMSQMYPGIPGRLESLFGEMAVIFPLFFLLLIDVVCRIPNLLGDRPDQTGFFEWLVRFVVQRVRRVPDDRPSWTKRWEPNLRGGKPVQDRSGLGRARLPVARQVQGTEPGAGDDDVDQGPEEGDGEEQV